MKDEPVKDEPVKLPKDDMTYISEGVSLFRFDNEIDKYIDKENTVTINPVLFNQN